MTESLIKALANSIECHTHPFEKDPQNIKAAKMMTAVLRASILRNEHGIADTLKSGINKILNEYKEKILHGMDV